MIGTFASLLSLTTLASIGQSPSEALLIAAERGELRMAADALADGANIDTRDAMERTPLMLATERGDETMVNALLNLRANPSLQDRDGTTALLIATRLEDLPIVEALLAAGADVTLENRHGSNALSTANAAGATEIVAALRGAGARQSLEQQLHAAIGAGRTDEVAQLIDRGVDVNARDTEDYRTPLMAALEHGHMDILRQLIEAKADPRLEATGIFTVGHNAITLAAQKASPWALGVLIDAGGTDDDLERALISGCAHTPALRVILETGRELNLSRRGDQGRTPLICAAEAGSVEAVSLLVEAGAPLTDTSDDGRTASEWARDAGHENVVSILRGAETTR